MGAILATETVGEVESRVCGKVSRCVRNRDTSNENKHLNHRCITR